MNKFAPFSSLIFTLFFISCYSDAASDLNLDNSTPSFENVDAALWSYFDTFQKEGKLRGITIDLEAAGITGVIKKINDDGVAGTCQFGNHIHHVTIDEDFWADANVNYREYVVFHELGHCYLSRAHNDQAYANGNCVSVMHSGLTDCRIIYGTTTRATMLDELFNSL